MISNRRRVANRDAPRDLAAIHQCHRCDHHCLLSPGGDDDLIRMTTRAAVIAQISRDRFAKIDIPAAGGVLEQVRALAREDLGAKAFPNFDGKFVQRTHRRHKRNARRACDSVIELFSCAFVRNFFNAF